MLELRAQDAQVGVLRLRRFELRFGLRHGFIRSDAGAELNLRQVQRIPVGRDRGIEQLLQRVLRAKLVVVHGDFGLRREAHIFDPRRWPARRRHSRLRCCGCGPRNPAATTRQTAASKS